MSYGRYNAAMASGYYPHMSFEQYMQNIEGEPEPEDIDVQVEVQWYLEEPDKDGCESFSETLTLTVEDTRDTDNVRDQLKEQLSDMMTEKGADDYELLDMDYSEDSRYDYEDAMERRAEEAMERYREESYSS